MPMLTHKHKGAVLTARFNRDGNKFLTGGEDGKVRLWDFHTGMLFNTFKDHACHVNDVDITSDNLNFCSCDADGEIFYSDLSTGCLIRKIRGHDSEVNAVRFNEFESVVVSAGSDHSVRIWDCRSQSTRPIQIFDSFRGNVMSLALTRTEILAGSLDETVRRFDLRNARELKYDLGQPVTCISLSSNGNYVITSCLDSTLRLLSVDPTRSTGGIVQEYKVIKNRLLLYKQWGPCSCRVRRWLCFRLGCVECSCVIKVPCSLIGGNQYCLSPKR